MKAFGVKSNAKANSRQTCGGDVMVSCRQKLFHFSLQTFGEGNAKVSCSEAQRRGACGEVSAEV